MKIEVLSFPSDNPQTFVARFTPETYPERNEIVIAGEALRGTSAIVTTPKIGEDICLSLVFHATQKNSQT